VRSENPDEKAIGKEASEFAKERPEAIQDGNGKGDSGGWPNSDISKGVP